MIPLFNRPSADLRNKYNQVSDFCHKYGEPVFITKNGIGDMVVMSIETYERLVGKFELQKLLAEDVFRDIESGLNK